MPSIKLLKRAELELFDACEWYEKQQKGLSLKFRAELKQSLNLIIRNAKLYPQKYNTDLRFAKIYKFPFLVVYWFDENLNTIFITSIFHTKRNPEKFDN